MTDLLVDLLLLGFLAWTVGDGLYGLEAVWGGFAFGTPVDAVYTLGPVLVSVAAWSPVVPETRPRPANRPLLMVVPAASTLAQSASPQQCTPVITDASSVASAPDTRSIAVSGASGASRWCTSGSDGSSIISTCGQPGSSSQR